MGQKSRLPEAPEHLEPATRAWWAAIVREYELESFHERLLTLCGESWDRGQQARAILAEKGLTFLDRFGQPRGRPEIAIERDCRSGFARLLRELALDVEPPRDSLGRPPRAGGGR